MTAPEPTPTAEHIDAVARVHRQMPNSLAPTACPCASCVAEAGVSAWSAWWMIVCDECGNKRCPHGTDHRHECTGSNEPGQVGSGYARMTSDAHIETITDRATIRDSDEPSERGDFPYYDLGPATSEARAAGGVDPKALAHALTTAHALIEAKAQLESVRHLLQLRSDALARVTREAEALRAKVAAVESLADQWADRKRSDGMSGNAWIGITLAGVAADLRAALATKGRVPVTRGRSRR